MKRKVTAVLTLLAASLFLVSAAAMASGAAKELVWGVGAPNSGSLAHIGESYCRTYKMTADEIGEFTVAGQKYRWKVEVEDNKYTSQGGAASAQKLMVQDGARVVSMVGGAPGLAAQPLVEAQKNVLYDVAMASPEILGPDKPHTFRVYQGSDTLMPMLIDWIIKNRSDIKTMAIVYVNDATGPVFAKDLKIAGKFYGLDILADQAYQPGTSDFYPVLQKVVSKNPDFIFIFGSAGAIIKAARELGFKGPFANTSGLRSADIEVAGEKNMEGMIWPGNAWPSPLNPPAWNKFAEAYKANYKDLPSGSVVVAYMAMHLFTNAMKKAGTVKDIDKIAKVLETQPIDSPVGPISYGGEDVYGINSQAILPAFISTYKNKEIVGLTRIEAPEVTKIYKQVFKK